MKKKITSFEDLYWRFRMEWSSFWFHHQWIKLLIVAIAACWVAENVELSLK